MLRACLDTSQNTALPQPVKHSLSLYSKITLPTMVMVTIIIQIFFLAPFCKLLPLFSTSHSK